jgi:hypothetical protein
VTNAVVADLDGNGFKEILYPSYDGRVHAYWLDKTEHGDWPFKVPGSGFRFAGEPIVADLDNDGRAEVIFTSWPENESGQVGQLHILNHLGQQLHAVNLPAPHGDNWNGGLAAPTLDNIDADADLELVIGTTASGVVAYDLPGTANARVLWGTGRGSYKRTGVSSAEEGFDLTANPTSRVVDPGEAATYLLKVQTGNAFSGTVTLNLSNPAPTKLDLNLPITDFPVSGGQTTLTVTHLDAFQPPLPGQWYNIPLTAVGGGITRTLKVGFLVGGSKTYLPTLRK